MVSSFPLLPDLTHEEEGKRGLGSQWSAHTPSSQTPPGVPPPSHGRGGRPVKSPVLPDPQLLLQSFPPQVTFRTSQHFPLYPLPPPRPTHTTCAQR